MIKKINLYPDPILKEKAVKVEPANSNPLTDFLTKDPEELKYIWSEEIRNFVEDLIDTASNDINAVGLAANQIWDKETPPPKIFVLKLYNPKGQSFWAEFINPEIVKTSGGYVKIEESCLSVPNYSRKIRRHKNLVIRFQTLKGLQPVEQKVFYRQGPLPIMIQHEYDHLMGKLIKPWK